MSRGNVLIGDGRILSVGAEPPPDGIEVLDVTGKFVLPGFIDAHNPREPALRGAAGARVGSDHAPERERRVPTGTSRSDGWSRPDTWPVPITSGPGCS